MFIAMDIGGTHIRVAKSSSVHAPKISKFEKIKIKNDYKEDLEKIIALIKNVGGENIEAIGVAIAGRFSEKGKLLISPNLSSWNNKDLASDLKKVFRCPVMVNNDAYASALAEAYYGHGKQKNFLFVIWGTGIGGSAVRYINNKIMIIPLEPGHQTTPWTNRKCACGQVGCWELSCGGAGIEKTYKKEAKDLNSRQWKEVTDRFAQMLMNTLVVRPNDLVIFSGAVAVEQTSKIKDIHNILKKNMKMVKPPSRLAVSKFKDKTGLYGALALLKK